MSYSDAHSALEAYRRDHIGGSLGDKPARWFSSAFSSTKEMLDKFSSDEENRKVAETYADKEFDARIPANLKLDYVISLRREVRKQYVSGDSDMYTDVTPFRHGAMSAHGASIFDKDLNMLLEDAKG